MRLRRENSEGRECSAPTPHCHHGAVVPSFHTQANYTVVYENGSISPVAAWRAVSHIGTSTYANATRPRHVIQPPFPGRMTDDQVLITNFGGQKPLEKNVFNPTPQARRPSKAASPSASGQTKKQLQFPVIKRGDRFKTQPATRHVVAALNLTVGRNDNRHHARSESA